MNTRIRKVELSNSAAKLPADWNIATGHFLRRCESRFTSDNLQCSEGGHRGV